MLGEHNVKLLAELGVDNDELTRLTRVGGVFSKDR